LRKRGMFAPVTHPKRGEIWMPGWPVKMSASNVKVKCAPLLGQDTADVLAGWVGMSADEINEYVKETPVKISKASSGAR
jgi:crotonobetainyl-CoA:carnitine CoA-transferase CaiB-like acyl-CoA transferase